MADEQKHPGGRPSKYREEYCKQLIKFFTVAHAKEYKESHTNQKGDTWSVSKEKANSLPTFEGFAAKIEVCVDTLLEWTKHHPEFSEAYTRAKDMQKAMLLDNGLKGLYNPIIVKFMAINCCGMKSESMEVTGKDGGPLEVRGLADIIRKAQGASSN